MRIKLNTDIQPMFPLLRLSFENPGPIEVDVAKLNPQQMLWIKNAVNKGVLIDLDSHLKQDAPAPVTPVAQAPVKDPKQMMKTFEVNRDSKEKEAATALKAAMVAITSLVSSSKDLLLLRTMQDLEGKGKKRKKLLDSLEARINELQSAVAAATGEPLDEKSMLVADRNLKNLPEVEEEIEEEKTFTINQE